MIAKNLIFKVLTNCHAYFTIQNVEFEWDENKNTSNIAKHRIAFADAATIFMKPHAVIVSTFSKEPRFMAIGMLREHIITVVFTRRGKVIRIISARRARHDEKEIYRAL